MAAPVCVLTSIKSFQYRGVAEEYSNTYMFDGSTPADATAWRALFDALNLAEKYCLDDHVSIVKAYGYNKVPVKGDSSVWSVDLRVSPNTPVVGQYTASPGIPGAGDTAVWIRWGLDKLNTDGKRVYLRKYYHPGIAEAATVRDTVATNLKTAMSTFATKMHDGTFIDGRKIVGPDGTAVIGHGVSSYITTRTLKRRGKRPGA